MAKHPRLHRRGGVWYHRAAIPTDIKDTYPKTEEVFSLRTSDYREAVKRLRVAAAEVDQRFEQHREELARQAEDAGQRLDDLSPDQTKQIESIYFSHLLDEDEEVRVSAFEGTSFEERSGTVEALQERNRHAYARGQSDDHFEWEAQEVLTWENVSLPVAPDSPAFRKVVRALQAAAIRAAEAVARRDQGEVIETPPMPLKEPAPQPAQAASQGPLLSALTAEWIAEKSRTSWVPKTENEHRIWMGHFIAVTGDRPLPAYGKAEARAFKAMLMKLPANWVKLGPLQGLQIAEAARKAGELGLPPMSDKNLNKLLGYVGSFWTWANRHYDDCPPNPFTGLKVSMAKHDVRKERDPFTIDELRTIFSAPLYTGCASAREWATPGPLLPRHSGVFWVPLLGAFSGARMGEIIQLYVEDVRTEGGITYFDINADGDDKRLKTAHSRRLLPVHRTLIDIGLLDFVAQRRKEGQKRLFPDLGMGNDGYYSSPFSKHFGRFLRAVGVKGRKNAFHSLRHNVEDALREAGVAKEVMDALQGHAEAGMSGRYGSGYSLGALNEALQKVRYEGLDLGHLIGG